MGCNQLTKIGPALALLLVCQSVTADSTSDNLVCKSDRGFISFEYRSMKPGEIDQTSYAEEDRRYIIFNENYGKAQLIEVACRIKPPLQYLSNVQYVYEDEGRLRVSARSSGMDHLFVYRPNSQTALSISAHLTSGKEVPSGMVVSRSFTCERRSSVVLTELCNEEP